MIVSFVTSVVLGLVVFDPSGADTPAASVRPLGHQHALPMWGRDVMITQGGCTYRRTDMPGVPARWILVPTLDATGRAILPEGCAGML